MFNYFIYFKNRNKSESLNNVDITVVVGDTLDFWGAMTSSCVCWHISGVQIPESLTKFSKRNSLAKKTRKDVESLVIDPVDMAKKQFQIAATAGCDLGLKWLERLEEEERRLLTG